MWAIACFNAGSAATLMTLRMCSMIRKDYVLPVITFRAAFYFTPRDLAHSDTYLGVASATAARYMRFCCNRAWYCTHSCSFPTFWFSRMARMSCSFSFKYF